MQLKPSIIGLLTLIITHVVNVLGLVRWPPWQRGGFNVIGQCAIQFVYRSVMSNYNKLKQDLVLGLSKVSNYSGIQTPCPGVLALAGIILDIFC